MLGCVKSLIGIIETYKLPRKLNIDDMTTPLLYFPGTTLKNYFGGVGVLLAIFALLVVACLVGHPRSKFRYYAKFIMVYYAVLVGTTILGPVFALRPRDVVNIQ